MAITKTSFGNADGKNVDLYTLSNGNGLVAKVATYGAILTSLEVPDREGQPADVVLGFDELAGYLGGSAYLGATVGRVGNRIRNATFELEGRRFVVAANNGDHHLHGGAKGLGILMGASGVGALAGALLLIRGVRWAIAGAALIAVGACLISPGGTPARPSSPA